MPPTFYDWISNLPPTSAWEESQSDVDISSLDFADSPYLTLTSSLPHNKKIKIDKFVMKRVDESGLLHLQVEMSFYANINSPFGLIYSLGSMPLANWDHCNIKPLQFLAIMIEYIFSDTYRISRVSILELLTHSVVLRIQRLFSSAFLAACTIAHRKENLVGMLQFPEEELDRAIMGSKLDFLTAMGNDGVDELMLMVASTFTQDYYDGNRDDEAHAVMKPFSFSKSLKSDPGSWMIRTYTPLLLMDLMGCNKESCDQKKDKLLHYALTLNHLQAVIQLRYTVEIFPDWIDVEIHIHNVECDITPFSFHQYPEREKEQKELGLKSERHFPSQILLSISPLLDQSNILNFSRTKSCQDPGTIRYQSEQSMGIRNCSWKFYQSEEKANSTGKLGWALHDNGTGKKIVSMTEPNMDSKNLNRFKRSHAWFRHENCSSLTKKVGVAFTDDCGHSFTWRVNRDLEGQTLRWLLSGFICLTYWPVQYDTSYCENICHEFSQHIEFKPVQVKHAIVPHFSLSLATPKSLATTPLLASNVIVPIHPITPPLVSSIVVAPTPPTTTPLISSNVVAGISNTTTPLVSSTRVAPAPCATTALVSSTMVAPAPPTTTPLVSSTLVAQAHPITTRLLSSTMAALETPTTTPLVPSTLVEPTSPTTTHIFSSNVVSRISNNKTPLVSSTIVAPTPPATTPLVSSTRFAPAPPTTTALVSSTLVAPAPPTTNPLLSSSLVAPAHPIMTRLLSSTLAALETPTTTPLVPSSLVEPTSPTTTHIFSSNVVARISNNKTPLVSSTMVAPTPPATTSLVSSAPVVPTPPTTTPLTSPTVVALVSLATTPLVSSTFVAPAHPTTTPLVSSTMAALETPTTTPLFPSISVEPTSPTTTPLFPSTVVEPTSPTTTPLSSTLVEPTSPTTTHMISSLLVALVGPALFDNIPNDPTPFVASEQLIKSSAQSTSQSPSSPKLAKEENIEKRLRKREGARTSQRLASSIGSSASCLRPQKRARHK